ncbi:MAG: peptidoglycan DD-metalloendopeptidase family protein [Candidatus Pacebacteria bacterium]|nr:peptidoglycan DD-metalloendopeptidase family protein [Candidatus Paceibacterota bacterium]
MKKFIFIILIIILFSFTLSERKTFAITAEEVKQQINKTNNQIEDLDREIAKYQKQIAQTSEEKNSLDKIIKELTLTRNQLLKEKEQIEKKISVTSLVIDELSDHIYTKEEIVQNSKKSLSLLLNELRRKDNQSLLEIILSKQSLNEISREYNDIVEINKNIKANIDELSNQKEQLVLSKYEKLDEQDKLKTLKKTLTAKELAVLSTKKEKDTLLNQTKNKEAEYKKLLAEQEKKRDAFEKELQEYESQLKFILNPKSLPQAGSEVLSWPLDNILITSLFGSRWGRTHYGLDFRASVGTSVKSVASGVVEGIGDTDKDCPKASFGKWIFIRHNNGLSSTYGHLSVISVKVGQKIQAGEIIGLSGNTGYSTGPHLHLSVYASEGVSVQTKPSISCSGKIFTQPIAASNAHLDPALYLPKITPSMIK